MSQSPYQSVLDNALKAATDTKHLVIGHDNSAEAARVFLELFPGKKAIIVADTRTFAACGKAVYDSLKSQGVDCDEPHIF